MHLKQSIKRSWYFKVEDLFKISVKFEIQIRLLMKKKYEFLWEELYSKNMRSLASFTREGLGHSEA